MTVHCSVLAAARSHWPRAADPWRR